jgi:hypothetical protein
LMPFLLQTSHPASPPDHHSMMVSLVVGWGGGVGGLPIR